MSRTESERLETSGGSGLVTHLRTDHLSITTTGGSNYGTAVEAIGGVWGRTDGREWTTTDHLFFFFTCTDCACYRQ